MIQRFEDIKNIVIAVASVFSYINLVSAVK